MKKFLAIGFCFILLMAGHVMGFSQKSTSIDSLRKALHLTRDTSKVRTLNAIAKAYLQTNPDSAKYFSQEALTLSESVNFRKGATEAYSILGFYYYESDPKLSAKNYEKALKIHEEDGNKKEMAEVLNNLGKLHFKQGDYAYSLDSYNKALKINEAIGAKKNVIDNYLTIGVIYKEKKNYKQAMEYQKTALRLALEINDEGSEAFIYDNIAQIYTSQDPSSAEALEFLLKANEIREKQKDKNSLMAGYNNIGIWFQNARQFDKAIGYFMKVKSFSEETGSVFGIAIANNNLGETYNAMGNYILAEECFDKSIQLSKKIQYKELLMTSYKGLSETYFNKKEHNKAYLTLHKYMNIKDSLLNETTSKQMAEVQTKYETEKKELQIAALSKDKEVNDAKLNKQQILIYSVSVGLLLLLALTFFILRGYRQKQSANLQLTEKNELIEEKNKDITDSINYARRIQKAILTSDKYLEAHLPEHFVLYKPKDIVSGDFYWAIETEEKKFIVVTADCTGHGVPGAFMSMIGVSKLNEIVKERKIYSPDQILNHLRDEVINSVNPEGADEVSQDGMDVSVCCYDLNKMVLEYAGANNPIYIVRNLLGGESGKTLLEYKSDKFPVGKFNGEIRPFTKKTIELLPSDQIYSFTDGYADQFGGEKGKKFKYKQLQELLLKLNHKPMQEQRVLLNTTIEKWMHNINQVDDILIIGVKIS